jgi:hypothetical protein
MLPVAANIFSTCPSQHGAQGVAVRLPPLLDPNPPSQAWIPPPHGWCFQPWFMVYASNAQYLNFRNLQYDPTPIHSSYPVLQINDLTSFQLPGNGTVYTSYGVNTPNPQWHAVLDYAGTGILEAATSQYSSLAWGCDGMGTPYYVSYSSASEVTHTPAGIDIMSTNDKGLDKETADTIVAALKNLPNQEVIALAGSLSKTVQDGERDGMPRVSFASICYVMCELIDWFGCRLFAMSIVRQIRI